MADRVLTGIDGFDELVAGGLPRGTVNLLAGPAGSGKSLFALHYAFHGASRYQEPSMYLVLEETKESLERVLRGFGMDPEDLERSGRFLLIDLGGLRVPGGNGSNVGLEELQDFLASSLKSTGVRRLVVDSLAAIGLYYPSPDAFRQRLFGFSRFLREQDVTTLLIAESPEGEALTRYGVEQFLADSFIYLGLEEVKGELRRTLTVRKMRFTKHDTAKHPVQITSKGLVVVADEKVV